MNVMRFRLDCGVLEGLLCAEMQPGFFVEVPD
jgi:hypothetical protein